MSEDEKRNPRTVRTRTALVAAGQRLFSEHPIDAVTVDDIVQAAEVGKGSFYNHFPDREALLRTISDQIRSNIEDAIDQANAHVEDPARRVARAVASYLRYALDEPERAKVLVRVHGGPTTLDSPLNRGLFSDLEQGLAAGRFAVPTVEVGALYVLGISQRSLARLSGEPTPGLAVTLAQQMCALLLRGLGIPMAEAELIAAQASDEIVRLGAYVATKSRIAH